MGEILIYNLSPEREARLKSLCDGMFLKARTVKKSDFGYTLKSLLERTDDPVQRPGEDFSEEMLYIAGLPGGMVSLFLDQLRREKLFIPLKAVMTETNLGFTSCELYRELCAEREAFAKARAAGAGF